MFTYLPLEWFNKKYRQKIYKSQDKENYEKTINDKFFLFMLAHSTYMTNKCILHFYGNYY